MALFGRRNVLLALLLLGAVVPLFVNTYHLFVANLILVYVLLSIGLNILVGFAPLKPAEFVVIRLQQMAGQIEV